MSDEIISFAEDDGRPEPSNGDAAPWVVLVADDEEQVHLATTFALADTRILGRPLRFVHAASAAEARLRLAEEPDVAVILLDVVMETEDAGLRLVEHVREDLGRSSVRIILRTGQPGYAPELDVIQRYDINDYRTKGELTHLRLVTALTAALRSFQQIETIEANRRGLEQIVAASTDLIMRRSLPTFAEGVLTQLCGLKGLEPEGVIVARLQDGNPARRGGGARVVAAAGRYAGLLGHPIEDVPDHVLAALRQAEASHSILTACRTATLPLKLPSGEEVTVYCELDKPLNEADRQLLEVFATNISVGFDNASLFESIRFLAYFDSVTGLPNRAGLVDTLEMDDKGSVRMLAVVEVEDYRNLVNSAGDALAASMMNAIAQRLTECFPDDQVAVLGEACFGVAAAGERDPQAFALEVKRAAERPVETPHGTLVGCVAVGVVPSRCPPLAEASWPERLRAGNIALQEAKRHGRGSVALYEARFARELAERLSILTGWNRALEDGQLDVHYQPQVNLSTGMMIGVEALLRWRRPDGSYLSPGVFIPIAEEAGIIVEIGDHVFDLVCSQIVAWHAAGLKVPPVGINVSVRQLMMPGFAAHIAERLARCGLPPRCLKIEVTESAFAPDLGSVRRELEALRALGMPVAIDDFGIGYSSLGQLHGLPVDELKLDRALIHGVDRDSRRADIVSLVVKLGLHLGLTVLAEGIETEAEAATTRALGVPLAQGYLFGRPCDRDAFEARLVREH